MAVVKDPARFVQALVGFSFIASAVWIVPKLLQDPAEVARVAAIQKETEERSFRVVCPDHFERPLYERWFAATRWCESYRDRI